MQKLKELGRRKMKRKSKMSLKRLRKMASLRAKGKTARLEMKRHKNQRRRS